MLSIIVIAAAVAAAYIPPAPRTFTDWFVGCDNGRSCQADGLSPENDPDGLTMAIIRAGAANAGLEIRINSGGLAVAALAADGRKLSISPLGRDNGAFIRPQDAAAFIEALRPAGRLGLLDARGAEIGYVSLRGFNAALLYMDEQQRRLGTVTALVRKGAAATVPPPPALPNIVLPPRSAAHPRRLSQAEIGKRVKALKCDVPASAATDSDHIRLDAHTTLVLFACERFAYNFASYALLIDEAGKVRDASFDESPGEGEGNGNRLVNPSWDPNARRLSVLDKGRGLGDCGVAQNYVWDGTRFRMVYEALMYSCRGNTDFIPTWRATVSSH